MKIYHLLFLAALPLILAGCLNQVLNRNQGTDQSNSGSIITAEKFCLAKGENNISSDEAYELALKSDCVKAGIIKEDCDCDPKTSICSFSVKADKPGCDPVCLVDLKNQQAEIDWRCLN